jgi:hypothetical protein
MAQSDAFMSTRPRCAWVDQVLSKSCQTNLDALISIPLSAALLLGKSKGLVQQCLLDQRGCFFRHGIIRMRFFVSPPRSSTHVMAGPARRGRCPDFLFGLTSPKSGRKLGRSLAAPPIKCPPRLSAESPLAVRLEFHRHQVGERRSAVSHRLGATLLNAMMTPRVMHHWMRRNVATESVVTESIDAAHSGAWNTFRFDAGSVMPLALAAWQCCSLCVLPRPW